MKKLINLLMVLAFVLTACGPTELGVIAPPMAHQNRGSEECETLKAFEDEGEILYCPPTEIPPTEVPPTETATDIPPTELLAVASTGNTIYLPLALVAPTAPFPGAPLCSEHNLGVFHTLWNAELGCHYDHEHGESPFTEAVNTTFPGLNLYALLGNTQIGHTNPSSPIENTDKHGGLKWQVDTSAPNGCAVGFESGTVAVDAYAIQYHAFGRQDVELEVRQHSAVALLRQCKPGNPSDKGYVYVTTLQEYGQRVMPYQGQVLPYPDNFQPQYASNFGPYFTTEGFGNCAGCRPSLAFYQQSNANNLSVWTSKRTGPVSQSRPSVPRLFRLLFRSRDAYQSLNASDLIYPFTWAFVCGGATYNPTNCRYNNSTGTIHEIAGDIPAAWDGLVGWDTDPRPGRVSVNGFVNQNGDPAAVCEAPGTSCYVIVMVGAFVGRYSSEISVNKVSNPTPLNTPERDIYFLDGQVVSETTPGAVPSGWIGNQN